jgi:spoIIIJ-associated protein
MIIGYHGESLAAMQRIIRIVFKDKTDKRIVLDVNGYRQQRTEKLQEMATQVAERVLATEKPYVFTYLPANERFIIHTTLAENPAFSELESVSEGEGFERRLVVRKKS